METKMHDLKPSEVDNLLADAEWQIAVHENKILNAKKSISIARKNISDWAPYVTPEAKAKLPADNFAYWEKRLSEMKTLIAVGKTAIVESEVALKEAYATKNTCDAEFKSRPWSRFWLVTNTGGHVHRNTRCTTCFPTTQYAFLPDYSGSTDAELIEAGGSSICTVCFPDAPVDTLKRAGTIEAPDKKAAREERERAKAEREAKKAAKAITSPDGTVLRLGGKYGERVTTESRAQSIAVDFLSTQLAIDAGKYSIRNTEYLAEMKADNELLLAALAHKRNQTKDEVLADLNKKAATKYKRDWK
jgi:hypothetical protein